MPTEITPDALFGRTVFGDSGEKLGKVDGVFLDDQTSEPEWVAVKTGLFGRQVSLVPLDAAQPAGEDLRVPYSKIRSRAPPRSTRTRR